MKKITDKQSFIDETRTDLRLFCYEAHFDVIDEEINELFCCVNTEFDNAVSGDGTLGIVMNFIFSDNGKMPDTPEGAILDESKIICTKTNKEFEFYGSYFLFPMTRQSGGSYLMKMIFLCEPNPSDCCYGIESLEEKFVDGIAKVDLIFESNNNFSYETFEMIGDMIIDGKFHHSTLHKENTICEVCEPNSLTFHSSN